MEQGARAFGRFQFRSCARERTRVKHGPKFEAVDSIAFLGTLTDREAHLPLIKTYEP